jgi:hypothetical protein
MTAEARFSETQQQELQTSVVGMLKTDVAARETFCRCWPCASDVLNLFLKLPKLPAIVTDVIRGIIKAGDLAHSTICK